MRLVHMGKGSAFAPGCSAHVSRRHRFVRPRRDRRRKSDRPLARGGPRAVTFGAPPPAVLRPRGRVSSVRRGSLPTLPRKGRVVARRAPRERSAGSGGQRAESGRDAPRSGRARIGRSGWRSRVVYVAEVARQQGGAKKRAPSISPDLEVSVDGRLARGAPRESAARSRVKTCWARDGRRKLHVTAPSDRAARAWRGKPATEGASDRRSGRIFTERSRTRSRPPRDCGSRGSEGGRAEATGASEVRSARGRAEQDSAREPGRPAEADRAAVNRRVPQSPSFEGRKARRAGRGASLGEMLGTDEVQVLVVRSSGKQTSVG